MAPPSRNIALCFTFFLVVYLSPLEGFVVLPKRLQPCCSIPTLMFGTTNQGDTDNINKTVPTSTTTTTTSRRDFATIVTKTSTILSGFFATFFFGNEPQPVRAATATAAAAANFVRGPVTVIGANGRTGYECVQALQRQPSVESIRACSRTGIILHRRPEGGGGGDGTTAAAAAASDTNGVVVEEWLCDVTNESTIAPVVNGASAVIFAASASKQGGTPALVDNAGLVAVAKACIDAKVPQLIIVSSGAVTKPSSPVYLFLNLFGKIMEEKIKGENTVRAMYATESVDLSYTVVRPGGLTEEPSLGSVAGLELNQGDTKSGRIARVDVAEICVQALYYPELTGRTTFECYNAGAFLVI